MYIVIFVGSLSVYIYIYACVFVYIYVHAQSCWTLCDPMDCSPPGSPSMGFFRQEYRSGLPFPPPGDLPDPGIEPASLAFPTLAGRFFTIVPPGKLMWFIEALHNSFLINFLRARDSKTWSDGPLGFRAP